MASNIPLAKHSSRNSGNVEVLIEFEGYVEASRMKKDRKSAILSFNICKLIPRILLKFKDLQIVVPLT